MLKKCLYSLIIPILVSCSSFHFAKISEPTAEVREIRYGAHNYKSRIVVELSEECKEGNSSGCRYSLTQNKDIGVFKLAVRGVAYQVAKPVGYYGKELDTVLIVPTADGVEISGKISEMGMEVSNPFEKPNLIILDIPRKSETDIVDEDNKEKEFVSDENTQKVDLLALRYGSHPDRTRVVLDLSDACVWEETAFPDSFIIQIKGATSKIVDSSGKKGDEVKKVSISSTSDGRTALKIDKGRTGGEVQVQLLDSPYRIVVDVFKLKDGQTQEQQFAEYLAGKSDISDNVEDLNDYDELLAQETEQPDDQITEADKKSVKNVASVLTKKQKAGKRIIVIDPGHGGKYSGTSFTVRKFLKYDYQTQYKKDKKGNYVYKTKKVKGKTVKERIPLTKTIIRNGRKKTVNVTKKVPVYKTIKTFREQDITLTQSKAIKSYFDKQANSPFKVILTRSSDVHLGNTLGADLAYRGEFALKNGADVFISIHVNSKGSDCNKECGSAKGFEIMYRSTGNGDRGSLDTLQGKTSQEKEQDRKNQENAKKQGKILAEIVSSQLKKNGLTEHKSPYIDKEGGNKKSIAVLRISRYPAILLESGYLCNEKDRSSLQKAETHNKVAESIYKGLLEYGKKNSWF